MTLVIPPAGALVHRLGNIGFRIGDMRIDITAMLVEVCNHFPTVLVAAIFESRAPLISAMVPASIPRVGEIGTKRLPDPLRGLPMMVLANGDFAGYDEQDGQ